MAETKKQDESKVVLELKPSEVFQLHLCVLNRMGNAQIKFCNAHNEEEQKTAEGLLGYLTILDGNLLKALKGEELHEQES